MVKVQELTNEKIRALKSTKYNNNYNQNQQLNCGIVSDILKQRPSMCSLYSGN